ncbi:MAG: deacylase [Nocardioidaceae bacterium]|nr:MAG: deacylase [Nocardioidaceae bacterium]
MPGSAEGRLAQVMAGVDRELLLDTVTGIVGVPSPTGAEAAVAQWISATMSHPRLRTQVQHLDELQANAVAVLPGTGNGESVLLYAPIDTFTAGVAELDVPWAAPDLRPDMVAQAVVAGDLVQGLGAGNPKGHAACVMVALRALAESGIELAGDVVAGFGAGGMPSFAVAGVGVPGRENTGHGVGATFLVERGFTTDHAIIAKPGWNVSHEEVGLVWLDVLVPGIHTYVGSRHRLPYSNAIAVAGKVTERLESWLEEYAARHEHSTMRPQGIVSSVAGGFERLAAATTAAVRLRLDVRLTTRQTPAQVTREVRDAVTQIGRELGVELAVRQVAAIPATHTSPESPVITSTVAAWEAVAGHPHQPILENSGATDANILRMRGIPTARVGMPKVMAGLSGEPVDFTLGMNLIDLGEARKLVEILVRAVLDLDARRRR